MSEPQVPHRPQPEGKEPSRPRDFIREIIDEDLRTGRFDVRGRRMPFDG